MTARMKTLSALLVKTTCKDDLWRRTLTKSVPNELWNVATAMMSSFLSKKRHV